MLYFRELLKVLNASWRSETNVQKSQPSSTHLSLPGAGASYVFPDWKSEHCKAQGDF